MDSVCAILNVYKRVDYLTRQIESLEKQTHKIDEYIVRVNYDESCGMLPVVLLQKVTITLGYYGILNKAKVFFSCNNTGVWSRFYAGFNAKSDYIFVVDDDIIPGKKRVEKCVNESKHTPGIYGSRGSLFKSLEIRKNRLVITESNLRPTATTQVDISGHSWFFERRMLSYMFDKLPGVDYPTAGEELRISFRASKYGIKTYIPAMTDDIETRGNKEPKLGLDKHANYNTEKDKYQLFYEYAISQGFVPLAFT